MTPLTSVQMPWGDGEYLFHLDIPQLEELERQTGSGVGEVFGRLANGGMRIKDMRETIRLGLIGGGTAPVDAMRLIRQYVDPRPLVEGVATAVLILGAAMAGNKPEESDAGNVPAAKPGRKASTSPRSKRPR